MEIIVLNGKEYQLDIEQAEKLGLLKEKDSRVRSWDEFNKKYKSNIAYGINEPLVNYRVQESSKSGNKLRSAIMTFKTLRLMI